jgi:VCBS repeat-containing protein
MATNIALETKVRIGSVIAQRGKTVSIPIEIIMLDAGVAGLWSFDITVSYDAGELNLLANDDQRYSLAASKLVSFAADDQDAFALNEEDSYFIEQQAKGIIRLSYGNQSGSGVAVNPAAISQENPYRLGILSLVVPDDAAPSDNSVDLGLTTKTTIINGLVEGQSEAFTLSTSEILSGAIEIDDSPKFLSETTKRIDENTGKDQPIYTIRASDDTKSVVFTIEPQSSPFYLLEELPSQSEDGRTFTQLVYLRDDPDFESKPDGYKFTVVARDRRNESRQEVTIAISDVDDTPPELQALANSYELSENLPAGYLIYKAEASDNSGNIFFALDGPDAGLFSIGNTSGELSINQSFDFEAPLNGRTDNIYDVIVVAYDNADPRNETSQSVRVQIIDVDENPPIFADGAKAERFVDENIGAEQNIYNPTVTDQSALRFSIIDSSDSDSSLVRIDAETGNVTLLDNPNYESKNTYQFTISATDAGGLNATQDVVLTIQDLDEAAIFKGSDLVFGLVTPENDLITDPRLEAGNLFTDDPDGPIDGFSLVVDKERNLFAQTLETSYGTIRMDQVSGIWQYLPKGEIGQSDFFDVVSVDFKGGRTFHTIELSLYSLEEGENYASRFEGSSVVTTPEDQEISGILKVLDLEGIETVLIDQPATGAVFLNTTPAGEQRADVSWIYRPKPDFVGSDSFRIVAKDKKGAQTYQTISVGVEPTDDPAIISSGNEGKGIRGNQIVGQLIATDVDGTLQYSILEAAKRGNASITTQGLWTYRPDNADVVSDAFIVQLTDPWGGTTTTSIAIELTAAPEPPEPPIDNNKPGQSLPSVTTPAPGSRLQTVDADNDGLLEVESTQNGELIDGNNDGTPDFQQPLVAGFRLVNTGASPIHFGALTAPAGLQLQFKRDPLIEPNAAGNYSFTRPDGTNISTALPDGLRNTFAGIVEFSLTNLTPGSSSEINVSLPRTDEFLSITDPSQHAYVKFNYTRERFEEFVDNKGNPLYKLLDLNQDGIFDSVQLTLRDGDAQWDGDGVANGTVVDPGSMVSAQRDFNGGDSADRLIGNVLANTLRGKKGHDQLFGDLGNDVLRGGAGNDRLDGGEGGDQIIGGGGSNRFIYRSVADSTIGQADTIRKLTRFDQFDLRQLAGSDLNLNFIGNDSFTGSAGELRSTRRSIQADLDGDGITDFQVNFTNKFNLSSNQLML